MNESARIGKAWIVSVGNELLVGRIVNTNASWLARKLAFLGLSVTRIITVPDIVDDIAEEVMRGLDRAHIIITTGGLGPTYDDLTLEGISKAVGKPLEINSRALEMVKRFYEERNMNLTPERIKMAKLPAGSTPIPNPVGAAPGVWLEHKGSIIIALPGVPREMESMFENYIEVLIKKLYPEVNVVECGITIKGVPESTIAPYINRLARMYSNVYIKSHPKGHETLKPILEVKVMVSSKSKNDALRDVANVLSEVKRVAEELGGEVGKETCI